MRTKVGWVSSCAYCQLSKVLILDLAAPALQADMMYGSGEL